MKFLIIAVALAAVASAQQYGQSQQQQQPIAIVRQAQDVSPDGSYNYAYETENGIQVQVQGGLGQPGADGEQGNNEQGQFGYIDKDGAQINVQYVADENGFQPQGAHLPTPPPIPEAIARALEFIRTHPSSDSEDGQYKA